MKNLNVFEVKRSKELQPLLAFIKECSPQESALIIESIRICHNNIIVWNQEHKTLDKVENVSVNEKSVQLNLQ